MVPSERISSDQLEQQLAPLYERLQLPEGRLELMTGIQERRLWPADSMPSDASIESARLALQPHSLLQDQVGLLIHASVCRDHLEPATACRVHDSLGLPSECLVYDVSNACLGLLNGMLQAAMMIELGYIRAAVVVGTEDSRSLLETTVASLNADTSLTRQDIKLTLASLTIGSASAAIVLCDEELLPDGSQLIAAAAIADTEHHGLCQSSQDGAIGQQMQPLMQTDSERLMQEGIRTGTRTFSSLCQTTGWSAADIDRTVCHQVGSAHRLAMLSSLELDVKNDFATFPWLGNTGSVALPITLAAAAQEDFLAAGQQLAMMGIGSGINCIMLAANWQHTTVQGNDRICPPPADRMLDVRS